MLIETKPNVLIMFNDVELSLFVLKCLLLFLFIDWCCTTTAVVVAIFHWMSIRSSSKCLPIYSFYERHSSVAAVANLSHCYCYCNRIWYDMFLSIHKITYTSLSAQAYYFHHLPRHLNQYTYSFQLDECVHFEAPNHCCSQLHPTLDYVEQFDSVKMRQ